MFPEVRWSQWINNYRNDMRENRCTDEIRLCDVMWTLHMTDCVWGFHDTPLLSFFGARTLNIHKHNQTQSQYFMTILPTVPSTQCFKKYFPNVVMSDRILFTKEQNLLGLFPMLVDLNEHVQTVGEAFLNSEYCKFWAMYLKVNRCWPQKFLAPVNPQWKRTKFSTETTSFSRR